MFQITRRCSSVWCMRDYYRQNNAGRLYRTSCVKCWINSEAAAHLLISHQAKPHVSQQPHAHYQSNIAPIWLCTTIICLSATRDKRALPGFFSSQSNALLYLPHLKQHPDSLKPTIHLGQGRSGGKLYFHVISAIALYFFNVFIFTQLQTQSVLLLSSFIRH